MKKNLITLIAVASFGFTHAQNMLLNWADPLTSATTTSSYGLCIGTYSGNDVFSAGTFQSGATGIDFDPGAGVFSLVSTGAMTDMYITRITALNLFNWAIRVDGTGEEIPTRIISNGSAVYVVGYFTQTANFPTSKTSAGGEDMFIARYDMNGNLVWVNRIGSIGQDRAMGICFDAAGNLLVCGFFSGTVAFDPGLGRWSALTSYGGTDAFFARYSPGGALMGVAHRIGGVGNDRAMALTTDKIGRILVCGNYGQPNCDFDPGPGTAFQPNAGSRDAFVASYSSVGVYNWANTFGNAFDDDLLDVVTDVVNDVYVTGGFDQGTIAITAPAFTNFATAMGLADIILAKCNSAGVWQWSEKVGDVDDDVANAIGLDSNNHVYISGYFALNADFDFYGADPTAMVSSLGGSRDIYIARYNMTTGAYNDVDVIAGTDMDRGHGMAIVGTLPAVYLTGEYGAANTDFLTGPGTFNLVPGPVAVFNSFIAKYDPTPLPPIHPGGGGTDNQKQAVTGNVHAASVYYPNPVSGTLFIENIQDGVLAEIYSLDGKKAGTWNANESSKLALDLSNLSGGMYLLRITKTDGSFSTEKIIVQH
ncbi:MAG: hypothetical protein FD123_2402 [Bacteroidetes bacterium]|nr:MAG: hypothetical protein FD123_2402 [Bacteroidota bacterium]